MSLQNSIDQPHLVSLVLQSKKALHHGEQVCIRARQTHNASAQEAIEILALDAKVKWVSNAILEQLKLAASVAKCIEEKRSALNRTVKTWDIARNKSTDALESILDSLGRQVVPPDFHEISSGTSLFGSQHSEDMPFIDPELSERSTRGRSIPLKHGSPSLNGLSLSPTSPSSTIRRHGSMRRQGNLSFGAARKTKDRKPTQQELRNQARADRTQWKTLRDFVDERAIEEVLETIDADRNSLEDILTQTADYPSSLIRAITTIRESLPLPLPSEPTALYRMQDAVVQQDSIVASMAEKLESLAGHYDQMAEALKDNEAGEAFSDEDLQNMNRDTEELPIIMSELDDDEKHINGIYESLATTCKSSQEDLLLLSRLLNDLDELGDIMAEMLRTQDTVEVDCEESLTHLSVHIETLDHLHHRYVLYQTAFNKLLLEIARRRHYKTSVEQFVKSMQEQLTAMVDEENEVRKHFNAEYGASLPEDICLCIGNEPTHYDVLPWSGESPEDLPQIDMDLLSEAKTRLEPVPDIPVGPESL